jgi:heme oxygenase
MEVHLEKLREQAAECEMIRALATDPVKRELFAKLADHFNILAKEIEKAMQKVSPDRFQSEKPDEPSVKGKEQGSA